MFHYCDEKKCGNGVRLQVIRHENGKDTVVRDFVSDKITAWKMCIRLNIDRHMTK
jgi:hypothetical protein